MYKYYKKSHCTNILLEDEEKSILKFIETLTESEIKKIPWTTLNDVQARLRVRRKKNSEVMDRPTKGIIVDGFCRGNPGPAGYRGIDIETSEVLFSQGHLGPATNNVAEFLAIIHALMYCKKNGKHGRVYSDSEIAIAWVNKKMCGTIMDKNVNPELQDKIDRAERWLSEQKTYCYVDKWETKSWGENPADYGNK